MDGDSGETRPEGQFVDSSGRSRASRSNNPLVVDGRTDSGISGRRMTDAEWAQHEWLRRRGLDSAPGQQQKGNAP